MSPKILSILTAGLSALGVLWSALVLAEDPAAEPAAPSPTVLMLSNGEVFVGEIRSDDDGYVLKTKVGSIRYPRARVEQTFATLHEAYEYKKARTPDRDPDERMKLAQWCLAQKLSAEAKAELEAVLDLSPDYGPAKAMLFQLQAVRKPPEATRDAEVVRASTAEATPPRVALRSLEALREAGRTAKGGGVPEILHLPPPQALRRYREFAQTVHPWLQKRCVGCHQNPDTAFPLVPAPTSKDRSNELILRTNLDAVLKLIDPDDPTRSELLSLVLLPHRPSNQALLPGPNSPAYRQLAAWVQGLRPEASPPVAGGPMARGSESSDPPPEGFALDRVRPTPAPAPMPPRTMTPPPGSSPAVSTGSKTDVPPGMVFVPGMGLVPIDQRAVPGAPRTKKDKDAGTNKSQNIPPGALQRFLNKPDGR
jgi:hypothetical protein